MRIISGVALAVLVCALALLADSGQTVPFPPGYRTWAVTRSFIAKDGRIKELQPAGHGEYVVVLRSGVRLQSGRSYHEKLKGLASNPF
jgi:hypothetical protein